MKHLLIAALAAALVAGQVFAAPAPPASPAEVAQLRAQVAQLQQQLWMSQKLQGGYATSVQADQDTIAQLRADVSILQDEVKALTPARAPAPAPRK